MPRLKQTTPFTPRNLLRGTVRNWTLDEMRTATRLRLEGQKLRHIAHALGRTSKSVLGMFQREGLAGYTCNANRTGPRRRRVPKVLEHEVVKPRPPSAPRRFSWEVDAS